LARLRDEYLEFTARGAEILAVGPDGPPAFALYWRAERLPFPGLADPDHAVARRYKQEISILKLGRMPLVIVVDSAGLVRYAHYGSSMADIPENGILLEVIEDVQSAKAHNPPRG
jgi:peroxiredoxin Q/BCP